MKLVSSNIFFSKKVVPPLLFSFYAFFIIKFLFFYDGESVDMTTVVTLIFGLVFTFLILKKVSLDLIDKVYDEGESLLFKNWGKEVRVSLSDIKNVSFRRDNNPATVTLSIRYKTDLGNNLIFCAPSLFFSDGERVIDELIRRIADAQIR